MRFIEDGKVGRMRGERINKTLYYVNSHRRDRKEKKVKKISIFHI